MVVEVEVEDLHSAGGSSMGGGGGCGADDVITVNGTPGGAAICEEKDKFIYLLSFEGHQRTHSSNNMALGWHTNFSSSHFFARAATFSSSITEPVFKSFNKIFSFFPSVVSVR